MIKNMVRIAGYHLRNIAFVKKYLGENSARKLVINDFVTIVDYWNSNLPKFHLKKGAGCLEQGRKTNQKSPDSWRNYSCVNKLRWYLYKLQQHCYKFWSIECISTIPERADAIKTAIGKIIIQNYRCNLVVRTKGINYRWFSWTSSVCQKWRHVFQNELETYIFWVLWPGGICPVTP